MARPFSYPEVPALVIGGQCLVEAPISEVRRKVALHAARARKAFQVLGNEETGKAYVLRLPDPEPQP